MSDHESEKSSSSRMGRETLSKGRIVGSYVIEEYIGHGGYSDIYKVTDPKSRKNYAIKLEEVGQKKTAIINEGNVYKDLNGVSRLFPDIIKISNTTKYNYIAMELLGPSLSQFKKILPNQHYSIPTSIRLSKFMLTAIQIVHEKGYIHRDIKPGNFLIRDDETHPLVLIDFGLSKKYIDENAHECLDLSRKDDLLSWFYSVLELVDGKLPWSGINDSEKIEQIKKSINTTQLCSSLPEEYHLIYEYIQTLTFESEPDYKKLFEWINRATIKAHCEDSEFEWYTMPKEQIRKVSKTDIVPPQRIRFEYKTSTPSPKPVYKSGGGSVIEPPRTEPPKPYQEFDIGIPQHNVEDYRKKMPPSPFVKGPVEELPSIPREPKKKTKDEEESSDEYDSDEDEPKKCRI